MTTANATEKRRSRTRPVPRRRSEGMEYLKPAGQAARCKRASAKAKWSEQAVSAWNARHVVGRAVRYWPGTRDEEGLLGFTSTPARDLNGVPVVCIEGAGAIALTHVQPISDEKRRAIRRAKIAARVEARRNAASEPPAPAPEEVEPDPDEQDTQAKIDELLACRDSLVEEIGEWQTGERSEGDSPAARERRARHRVRDLRERVAEVEDELVELDFSFPRYDPTDLGVRTKQHAQIAALGIDLAHEAPWKQVTDEHARMLHAAEGDGRHWDADVPWLEREERLTGMRDGLHEYVQCLDRADTLTDGSSLPREIADSCAAEAMARGCYERLHPDRSWRELPWTERDARVRALGGAL